jgi:DNA-directed RNA polymerase specialized sigma24 family protein
MTAEELVMDIHAAKENDDYLLASDLYSELYEGYLRDMVMSWNIRYVRSVVEFNRYDEEDIMQDFQLRVYDRIHSISIISANVALYAYLKKIYYNCCMDYMRKKAKNAPTVDYGPDNEGLSSIADEKDELSTVVHNLSLIALLKDILDGINNLRINKKCEHKILAFHQIHVLDRLRGGRDYTDSNNLQLVLGFAMIPFVQVADMCEEEYREVSPVQAQFPPHYYMSAMYARLMAKGNESERMDMYDNCGNLVRDCGDWIRQVKAWARECIDPQLRARFEALIY